MENTDSDKQIMSANVMVIHFDEAMNINLVFIGQINDGQFKITKVMSSRRSQFVNEENIRQATESLIRGRFHALPVIDSEARIVGTVSRSNLVQYLSEQYLDIEDHQ
jgi:predicted transcriptional regulator